MNTSVIFTIMVIIICIMLSASYFIFTSLQENEYDNDYDYDYDYNYVHGYYKKSFEETLNDDQDSLKKKINVVYDSPTCIINSKSNKGNQMVSLPLTYVHQYGEYIIHVNVGRQKIAVVPDTGSSILMIYGNNSKICFQNKCFIKNHPLGTYKYKGINKHSKGTVEYGSQSNKINWFSDSVSIDGLHCGKTTLGISYESISDSHLNANILGLSSKALYRDLGMSYEVTWYMNEQIIFGKPPPYDFVYFKMINNIPMVYGKINGITLKLLFDTGNTYLSVTKELYDEFDKSTNFTIYEANTRKQIQFPYNKKNLEVIIQKVHDMNINFQIIGHKNFFNQIIHFDYKNNRIGFFTPTN